MTREMREIRIYVEPFFTGGALKLTDFDQGSLSWDESLKLISDLSQFSCPKLITYLMGESQNLDQLSFNLCPYALVINRKYSLQASQN